MSLEILEFGARKEGRPPLLLIHGAYCGAWVWQRHFMPFLASNGYHGIAISLRGHGQSDGHSTLDLLGIQDFVDDAEYAASLLESAPVVIGHSMGGLIAQIMSTRHPLKGMALLAAVPPHGLATAATQMWMEKPGLFSQLGVALSMGGWSSNPQQVANNLFSMETPSWEQVRFLSQFQRESTRAAFEIMLPQLLLAPTPLPPVFVLGGDTDAFIPKEEIASTAHFWNVTATIVPTLPHEMMLDERWIEAAQPLIEWLGTL